MVNRPGKKKPVFTSDIEEFLQLLFHYKVEYLIIGGEAEGASESARKLENQKISIPMSGNIESLNAGVAGSVLMFEVVRQRSNL